MYHKSKHLLDNSIVIRKLAIDACSLHVTVTADSNSVLFSGALLAIFRIRRSDPSYTSQ